MKRLLAVCAAGVAIVGGCTGHTTTCVDRRNCTTPTEDAMADVPEGIYDGAKKDAWTDDVDLGDADRNQESSVDAAYKPSDSDGALDASNEGPVDSRPVTMVWSVCNTNEDCQTISSSFFCLKSFESFPIQGGMCTRICEGTSRTDCTEIGGNCISETLKGPTEPPPRTACFPTCKLDQPCRTGLKCQFVYFNDMLVEPSTCVPLMDDAATPATDQ